ncbi:MAG: O-antigen ligase family protein [Paracoccaceae bacterium]|nr:O-antigen ligase family protein [Paracoccaceae bacterium]
MGGARILLELLTAAAALGAVAFWLGGTGLMERSLVVEGDTAFRLELYQQIVGMIRTRPLTGYGMDALAPAYELFRAPAHTLADADNRILYMGHNTYLTLWAELGGIAGSLPMLALGLVGLALVRRVRQRETRLAMPAAALGALLLGAVHSLGDFSLEIPGNVFLFLALIGLGVAHNRASGRPGPPSEDPSERRTA